MMPTVDADELKDIFLIIVREENSSQRSPEFAPSITGGNIIPSPVVSQSELVPNRLSIRSARPQVTGAIDTVRSSPGGTLNRCAIRTKENGHGKP